MPNTGEHRLRGGAAMTWRRTAAVLPGIGVALMPKLICPLCWPAYAGLLSAVGLGFLINSRNLLIVTAFVPDCGRACTRIPRSSAARLPPLNRRACGKYFHPLRKI